MNQITKQLDQKCRELHQIEMGKEPSEIKTPHGSFDNWLWLYAEVEDLSMDQQRLMEYR